MGRTHIGIDLGLGARGAKGGSLLALIQHTAYWDARTLLPTTAHGAAVASFPGGGTTPDTLAQLVVGSRPLFNAVDGNALGCFDLDGSRLMTGTINGHLSGTGPFGTFALFRPSPTAALRVVWSCGSPGLTNGFSFTESATTHKHQLLHEGVGALVDGDVVDNAWTLVVTAREGSGPTALSRLWVKSGSGALTAASITTSQMSYTASTGPVVLAARPSGGSPMLGKVAAFGFVIGRVYSTDEMALMAAEQVRRL